MRAHRSHRHEVINVYLDSVTITLPPDRVTFTQVPATPARPVRPEPAPTPRPVDMVERTVVRPQMIGNEMFFFPEQELVPASTAPQGNPIADFFAWLFGWNKAI